MTSDHNPGRPAARRRMAGYQPLAAAPAVPATDSGHDSTADRQEPGPAAAPLPSSAATTDAPSAENNGVRAEAAAQATTAAVPPARKRRMSVTPTPDEARSTSTTTTKEAGGATAAEAAAPTPSAQGTDTPGAGAPVQPPTSRPRWTKVAAIIAGLLVVAAAVVLGARWLRTLEGVQQFIASYDGHGSQPGSAPEGIPAWLGWQHFLNMFFIVLIIRTGLQVRTERKPPSHWTAKKNSFFAPRGNSPKKVSLSQWLHQCLDVLWLANGLVFGVLLFATGQWKRIVPTHWDVVPNMLSTAIQYASLDWPVENGWIHYNALQVMAYFVTVFIAAPLAVLSGIRFSTWWPEKADRLNKAYPVEWARAVHFPVMLYFVAFTIVHIFLVSFTGALRNLNHMYTSRDVTDWWGLVAFLASLSVVAAAWFLTQPLFTTPIATRMGKVTR